MAPLMSTLIPRLMPHLIGILIVAVTSLTGCTSEHEREVNEARTTIRKTIRTDWNNRIPVDELVHADQLCKKYDQLQECDLAADQLLDITVSLASCKNDMRSTLCQKLVTYFEKSPLAYLMTASKPIALPDSPFYWSMPTAMLEVLAARFEYQAEATRWWWKQWHLPILSFAAAILFVYGALLTWTHWERRKKIETDCKAELLEQEKARQAFQARLRAEAKARAEAETQQRLAEQERIMAAKAEQELLAQQLAAEKLIRDKLVSEQAEVQQLLSTVFSNTKKPKRRKHDSSSK